MASTARFLFVPQNKTTLAGPYIVHARKPHCILEFDKAPNYVVRDSVIGVFKIIKEIEPVTPEEKARIEDQAMNWYFSQVSQNLLSAACEHDFSIIGKNYINGQFHYLKSVLLECNKCNLRVKGSS